MGPLCHCLDDDVKINSTQGATVRRKYQRLSDAAEWAATLWGLMRAPGPGTVPGMSDKSAPTSKALTLFKAAIAAGYRVDAETGKAYRPDGSEWKPITNPGGYLQLQIKSKLIGGHLTIPVHKAVAFLKFGEQAFGGVLCHVRHLDGDKLNNASSNIALGTPLQNKHDTPGHVLSNAGRKRAEVLGKEALSRIRAKAALSIDYVAVGRKSAAAAGSKKLSESDVRKILANAALPASERVHQRVLAASLGVKQGTVCDVIAGRCYGDVANGMRAALEQKNGCTQEG